VCGRAPSNDFCALCLCCDGRCFSNLGESSKSVTGALGLARGLEADGACRFPSPQSLHKCTEVALHPAPSIRTTAQARQRISECGQDARTGKNN
jgi:hypothetical protein